MYDVQHITGILREAGRIANRYFLRTSPGVKADHTYVTEADVAVQSFLRDELGAAYPQDGIIGEEEDLRRRVSSGSRIWIVDPIDGTAAFVSGFPIWGISVALMAEGKLQAGFFFMPVTGDLFHTTPDGRVLRNGEKTQLAAPRGLGRESVLLVGSRFHQRWRIDASFPGKIRSLGSTVAHFCYIATSSADAALVCNVYIWDLAAGVAMLTHNGGILTQLHGERVDLTDFLSGAPLSYPVLGGHPRAVEAFSKIIRTRDESTGAP